MLVGAFNQEKTLVGAFSVIVKLRRWFVCSSNKDESFNGGCEDDLFCLLLATPRAELNCEKKPGLAALDAESELDAVLRQLRAREARLYTGDLEKDIATRAAGGQLPPGLESRASNEGSQRFHNHG